MVWLQNKVIQISVSIFLLGSLQSAHASPNQFNSRVCGLVLTSLGLVDQSSQTDFARNHGEEFLRRIQSWKERKPQLIREYREHGMDATEAEVTFNEEMMNDLQAHYWKEEGRRHEKASESLLQPTAAIAATEFNVHYNGPVTKSLDRYSGKPAERFHVLLNNLRTHGPFSDQVREGGANFQKTTGPHQVKRNGWAHYHRHLRSTGSRVRYVVGWWINSSDPNEIEIDYFGPHENCPWLSNTR